MGGLGEDEVYGYFVKKEGVDEYGEVDYWLFECVVDFYVRVGVNGNDWFLVIDEV